MPDLTVVEGGGDRKAWDRQIAQQHFEEFVIVLLRTLASGDRAYRLTEEFFRFLEHAQNTGVPIGPVLDGALSRLHDDAFGRDEADDHVAQIRGVTQAALRVTAESMATDGLARARLSKREDSLRAAIEHKVLGSEGRSRENGWSYLARLTEHLGPWPPRAVRAPARKPQRGRRPKAGA